MRPELEHTRACLCAGMAGVVVPAYDAHLLSGVKPKDVHPGVPALWIGGSPNSAGPIGSKGIARLIRPRRNVELEPGLRSVPFE